MSIYLIESKTTMVSLSWNITKGIVMTEIRISYFNTDEMCFNDSSNVSLSSEKWSHNLRGLEEYTKYVIEITVSHDGYIIGGDSIIVNTAADCKICNL